MLLNTLQASFPNLLHMRPAKAQRVCNLVLGEVAHIVGAHNVTLSLLGYQRQEAPDIQVRTAALESSVAPAKSLM